jgi:hypothetical protein
MSLITFGLGVAGGGTDQILFGDITAVEVIDEDIEVTLDDEIDVAIEQTPDIEVEIDGDIEVEIEDDDINVEIPCP